MGYIDPITQKIVDIDEEIEKASQEDLKRWVALYVMQGSNCLRR